MLIENQLITVTWNKRNKEWYEKQGFLFTGYGDAFDVRPEQLTHGSKKKRHLRATIVEKSSTYKLRIIMLVAKIKTLGIINAGHATENTLQIIL